MARNVSTEFGRCGPVASNAQAGDDMTLEVGPPSSIASRKESFALDNSTTGFDAAWKPPVLKRAMTMTLKRRQSPSRVGRRPSISPPKQNPQGFALYNGTTGIDHEVQNHETRTRGRRRSSLFNEDFRDVTGRRRSSIAHHGVESFENLINWANNRPQSRESSCSHNGKVVPAASEEPDSQQLALSSRGLDFLGEKAPPLLLRIPTVGNMTSGVGPSHKKLMVLDSQASFPESLLLMAALDASNNFPEAQLISLDVQTQSTPNSAPDQSSQKPKLLDQDATTTEATRTEADTTDMGQLHVRQKARKGLTSHFHHTVATFKDTLLFHSPQINPLIKRILLAHQAAYANSSDESDAFHGLMSGNNRSRKPSRCESDPSSGSHHVDKEITAAAENISTLPLLLKTESHMHREKICLELPTNEFIEQRGGSCLKAIDLIPLSVIQTEDSPDRISEGEEDCIIDDGAEERHASHMEELREQNEHKGKHNSLSAAHHTHTRTHAHAHNGRRNSVFEQHRLSITAPNKGDGTEERHASHLGVRWEQTEHNGRRNSMSASHHTHTHTHTHNGKRHSVFEPKDLHRLGITASNVHPLARALRTLPSEQRGAVHTKKTPVSRTSSS
jgi:hypothetical protein